MSCTAAQLSVRRTKSRGILAADRSTDGQFASHNTMFNWYNTMWILGLTPTTRTTVIVVRNKQVSAREEHIQLKKNIFSCERIFSAEEEYFQPLNIVAPVAHPVLYLLTPCTQPPTFSVLSVKLPW